MTDDDFKGIFLDQTGMEAFQARLRDLPATVLTSPPKECPSAVALARMARLCESAERTHEKVTACLVLFAVTLSLTAGALVLFVIGSLIR